MGHKGGGDNSLDSGLGTFPKSFTKENIGSENETKDQIHTEYRLVKIV